MGWAPGMGETSMLVDRSARTLRELATEKMRDAILDLRLKPGDRLVERDLCVQLGVSRTVVREVLRHLEAEGLVDATGHRPTVARPTPDQAAQIYEIRAQLEGMAARACAARGDAALAEALEAALGAIRAAYAKPDLPGVLAATRDFYRLLFEGSERDIAWGIVCSLNARITHLRAMTIATPGRDRTGPDRMARIVAAIRAGDGDAAAQACIDHVGDASAIARALLEAAPG